MLKGTVNLRASISGNGVKFESIEFNPRIPGVDKVVIEAPDGNEILATVHFGAVRSEDEAKTLATKVIATALDRLAFNQFLVIENQRVMGSQFSPVNPRLGTLEVSVGSMVLIGEEARLVRGISPAIVKAQLEQAAPPGEHNYALFRSAMQAPSPVEEFMLLYNMLLMILGDTQPAVDAFIGKEEPAVPVTTSPHTGGPETIYTRLRNEIGHRRAGVKLENTRAAMAGRVAGLRALTKRAIELHP